MDGISIASTTGIDMISPDDENLLNTWSSNPHAKISIPRKPSKSSLIGV